MNFLHWEIDASSDSVVVTLDKRANVCLLDPFNFNRYQRGDAHRFYGGLAKRSPVRLSPPRAGHWHVVVDLGGYAGTVRASVQVVS